VNSCGFDGVVPFLKWPRSLPQKKVQRWSDRAVMKTKMNAKRRKRPVFKFKIQKILLQINHSQNILKITYFAVCAMSFSQLNCSTQASGRSFENRKKNDKNIVQQRASPSDNSTQTTQKHTSNSVEIESLKSRIQQLEEAKCVKFVGDLTVDELSIVKSLEFRVALQSAYMSRLSSAHNVSLIKNFIDLMRKKKDTDIELLQTLDSYCRGLDQSVKGFQDRIKNYIQRFKCKLFSLIISACWLKSGENDKDYKTKVNDNTTKLTDDEHDLIHDALVTTKTYSDYTNYPICETFSEVYLFCSNFSLSSHYHFHIFSGRFPFRSAIFAGECEHNRYVGNFNSASCCPCSRFCFTLF
jgi:hypothetical protein